MTCIIGTKFVCKFFSRISIASLLTIANLSFANTEKMLDLKIIVSAETVSCDGLALKVFIPTTSDFHEVLSYLPTFALCESNRMAFIDAFAGTHDVSVLSDRISSGRTFWGKEYSFRWGAVTFICQDLFNDTKTIEALSFSLGDYNFANQKIKIEQVELDGKCRQFSW